MVGTFAYVGRKLLQEWALSKMIFMTERTLRQMCVLFIQKKNNVYPPLIESVCLLYGA